MFKLYFVKCLPDKKHITERYIVSKVSDKYKDEYLGMIRYSGRWRQYVFEPDKDTMWSSSCLVQIFSFINECNKKFRYRHKNIIRISGG